MANNNLLKVLSDESLIFHTNVDQVSARKGEKAVNVFTNNDEKAVHHMDQITKHILIDI